MEQKSSIENSDEEDLPDLFSNQNTDKNNEISPGDIVWAEFRQLYWPSLVRCVYKKDKKASIWYLDSPRKCFKVPFKKIKSFSDPTISASIKEEVEKSPMKVMHKKVWFNAITYIRRQAEGHQDDPAAYFDLSQHYFAFKDLQFSTQKYRPPIEELGNPDSRSSDEESLVGSEDDIGNKLSLFHNLDDECENATKTNAIVECITKGQVDKQLLRIKAKKIPSQYQDVFEEAMKTDRTKLFGVTACGIVKSLKKLKEISLYLMNFYERVVEGGKCEMMDYVTSVWLPEAIQKAVELIDSQAEEEVKRKLFPADKNVKKDEIDVKKSVTTSTNNCKKNKTDKCKKNKKIVHKRKNSTSSPKKKDKKKTSARIFHPVDSSNNSHRMNLRLRLHEALKCAVNQ